MTLADNAITRTNEYISFFQNLNILRWIYDYPPLDSNKHFNDLPNGKPLYDEYYMGLINDPNYCDLADTFNILYP